MEESDVGNFWEEELMMSASGEQPKDITEKLWEEDSMMSGKENRKGKQKKALSNSKGKRLKQQQKKGIERLENYNPLSEEDLTRLFPAYPSSNEPCHCEKAKNEGKCECNYLLSFDVEDHEQIKHYLDVYGVCIVRLLDEETCQKTVDSFFEEANQKAKYQPIDINNPESWESTNWPGRGKFLFDTPAFTQQAYDNRTNEKFYKLSAYLFNEPKLYCSIDNWGLFRPTRNISFSKEHFTKWQNGRVAKGNLFEEKSYDFDKNEKLPPPENFIENYHVVEHATHVVMDRPDWRRNLRPHWDVNPWIFHKETLRKETQLLQSLVALVDCTDNGSFACVPCSHRYIPTWVTQHTIHNPKGNTTRPLDDDPMSKRLQRFPLRRGEMVIWNYGLVHANYPNYSSNWRFVQFIRMLPIEPIYTSKDRYCSTRILRQYPEQRELLEDEEIKLTPLGRKLVGLDPW